MPITTVVSSFYTLKETRKVVKLNNGNLYVVTGPTNGSVLNVYKSTDNGVTWSAPIYSASSETSNNWTAITDGTYIMIASSNGLTAVKFRRLDGNGVLQGSISTVNTGLTLNTNSFITMDRGSDGVLHVAFIGKTTAFPSNFNVIYSKSTDNGVNWAAQHVTTSGDFGETNVAVYNNIPIIQTIAPGYSLNLYGWNGSAWVVRKSQINNATNPSSSGRQILNSSLLVKKSGSNIGRMFAAWIGLDATDASWHNIRFNYSDDGGTTWNTETKITTGNTTTRQSVIMTENSNGDIYLFYIEGNSGPLLYVKCVNGTTSFGGLTLFCATTANWPNMPSTVSGSIPVAFMEASVVKFNSLQTAPKSFQATNDGQLGGTLGCPHNNTIGTTYNGNAGVTISSIQVRVFAVNGAGVSTLYPRLYNATTGALLKTGPGVQVSALGVYMDMPLSSSYTIESGVPVFFAIYATNTTSQDTIIHGVNPIPQTFADGFSVSSGYRYHTTTGDVYPNTFYGAATCGFGATYTPVPPNTAPNVPGSPTPVFGSVINAKRPVFTWSFSDPNAGDTQSAFNIQVDNAPDFVSVVGDSGWISGSQTSYTWSNDLGDGVYYYRIRTRDQSGAESPWSTVPLFRIDTVAPTGFPIDSTTRYLNAFNKSDLFLVNAFESGSSISSVKFATWGDSGGQNDLVWYEGTFDTGNTWYAGIDFADHDGGIDQHYNIHVYAYDVAGNNAMIAAYNVYVDTVAPATPTQTNGVLYAGSNDVSWSAFSDAAPSSGLGYTVMNFQSWNGSSWVNVATYPKTVTGLTHSFTPLTSATQYRWGIVYGDSAGNESILNYTTFTTNTYSVTTTLNLTSTGNVFTQRPKFKFVATDVNDATLTQFRVQVSTANTFFTTVIDVTYASSVASGATSYYTPVSDLGVGVRYVRIRAFDGKDWGSWSPTISFTIQTATWPTTIAADDTAISKRTIDDLRTKVNAARQARGLAAVAWTDETINDWNSGTPTDIRVAHLVELRQAIVDIYLALAITSPTWTDPTVNTSLDRKGIHWIELRNALLAS